MPDVSKHKTNAERLAKHREGVATTLRRLEVKVDDLTAAVIALAEERADVQLVLPEKYGEQQQQENRL